MEIDYRKQSLIAIKKAHNENRLSFMSDETWQLFLDNAPDSLQLLLEENNITQYSLYIKTKPDRCDVDYLADCYTSSKYCLEITTLQCNQFIANYLYTDVYKKDYLYDLIVYDKPEIIDIRTL